MKKQTSRMSLIGVAAMLAYALSGQPGVSARVAAAAVGVGTSTALECEGTACGQVTLTFDEQKQQYRVQNDSADTYARVSASNYAASAEACVGPGKSAYLPLRSIVGAYRADASGSSCGSGEGT